MASGLNGRDSGGSDRFDLGLIAELRGYWEALREGNGVPRRDRIDPRGIAGALEHTFLIERIAPGIARFRIAGMLYSDLMAMDVRGMPVSCLFLGTGRERLQLDLERVFRSPSILSLSLQSERRLGRAPLLGRMQMMPLRSAWDDISLAIGCLELNGEIGRAPSRFAITNTRHEALNTESEVPAAAPVAVAERPPRSKPGVPYLRLVKG